MDEEKGEPDRHGRIAALLIANAVGRVARGTIVVVDEADDLLAGLDEDNSPNRRGSKVFMNRLVESATAPTIWITNDVDCLGPAIIRRMNLVLRFPKPSISVRKTMVARIATSADFRLNETALEELAGNRPRLHLLRMRSGPPPASRDQFATHATFSTAV
jgi:transitional endoplasmic reticulum ATPase